MTSVRPRRRSLEALLARALTAATLITAIAAGGSARAQDSTPPLYVAGEESEALQALRADEEGLFRENQALGENVSNIPEDRFIKRLQGNETALAKKHGCRKVRFQVKNAGNSVALQPVLIR